MFKNNLKKKIWLIILLIILFVTSICVTNANRDRVSSVNYGADIHNPLNVSILLNNVGSGTKIKIPYSNFFDYASFSSLWCTIPKLEHSIKIRHTTSSPNDNVTCKINIEITSSDIKNYVKNYLENDYNWSLVTWEEDAILNSITYWLVDQYEVKLKTMTDSNWGSLPSYTSSFPIYNLEYNYTVWWSNPDSLPACSDWEDNDWDWHIDYLHDTWCVSQDDISEEEPIFSPSHTLPEVDLGVISINDKAMGDSTKIIMMADIQRLWSYIPLWKILVTKNWSNNWSEIWIKEVVATVMNKEWTAPLSDNCIYRWTYNSSDIKKKGDYLPVYINDSCTEIQKAWEYKLSYQFVDEAWYSLNEKIYNLIVIPWDIELSQSTFNISWTNVLADTTEFYNLKMKFKDKYGNIIKNREVINNIIKLDDNIKINELTNTTWASFINLPYSKTTDSNWEINDLKISSYNYSWNKLKLKLIFNKFKAFTDSSDTDSSDGYVTKNWTTNYTINETVWFKPLITNVQLLTWANWQVLQLWQDIQFKLKVKNVSSSKNIENVKIKYIPKIYNKFWSDITNKFNITVSTGDFEDNTKKVLYTWLNIDFNSTILSNWWDLWTINGGSGSAYNFKIRVEFKDGVETPEVKLGWYLWIKYDINNSVQWIKTAVSKYKVNSNITLKYWWVYVKWMYSNAAKWLYELARKWNLWSMQFSSVSNNSFQIKTITFNNIVKKITQETMDIHNLTSVINGTISWKYKNNGDITINGWNINWKSLIFADWWNIYIKWNIRKTNNDDILTILSIKGNSWNKGKIIIDPSVTNIDAVIITEWWIFSFDNMSDVLKSVMGKKNDKLKNQLVIYWFILSQNNTIWWSIKMNWTYVLPWWKETNSFYTAWVYDLNYLRRYHKDFNKWRTAIDPITSRELDESKYWTYPTIIIYDNYIRSSKPYGF